MNNDIFISRDERRLIEHVLRRNPLCARNKLRIGQEIEGLTNIKEKNILLDFQITSLCSPFQA